MRCSICDGGKIEEIAFACDHKIILCSKCSSNIDQKTDCAECQHLLFAAIEQEINEAAEKKRAEQSPSSPPEKKTEVRTNSPPVMRSSHTNASSHTSSMTRWPGHNTGRSSINEIRCNGCQYYFCICSQTSRIF